MATIYSNRNDNSGTHITADPNATTTWAGGVVPSAADQVYIVGSRTTINQTAFAKWSGTKTITVVSTTNFASSGFFYTYTDRGQLLKVNYTSTTATTFVGCTLDETEQLYQWSDAGSISNGSYVHNPAYTITINTGETFECNELILAEGGWLLINGGTLKINQGILVRDGRLIGRGNGKIIISRPANTSSSSNIGYLTTENYSLSVVDIDGGENRAYGYLTSAINKGDGVAVVSMNQGTFAVGDEIAVYGENDYRRRNKGYTGYRDASASFKDMDEGLDVVGVNGNNVYFALRNGTRGTIKEVLTEGSQKVLNVDTDSTFFNAGDKIVVNNVVYTVDSVSDSEYTLYDYDFTNSSTSLSDFWVNDPSHVYSSGWAITSGVGIKNSAGAYRELVHKYCWKRDVIVEAYMSPLSAFSGGTRGDADFGLMTSYDPSFKWGHRGFDSFKTDYLRIDDNADVITFNIRAMSNASNNRLSRDGALRTKLRSPALYRIDTRKNFTSVYIDNVLFTKEYRRDGGFKGLVGLFVDANTNFSCAHLTIKTPTQKLYITTTDNIIADSRVFRTGAEIAHVIGSKIVKIASVHTTGSSHVDLAYAYRGQNGNGEWPHITQVNGANATNSNLPYVHNHDMNPDYYYDLGNATTEKSVTIDLGSVKQFSHVSFVPRVNDYSTYYGFNGVAIYGSIDGSSWATLQAPTNDTKKWYYSSYGRTAFYSVGTVAYRYVKFATAGSQHGTYQTNRYVNVGVHDFSNGYTINVNNTSDFVIGDTITALTDGGYSWTAREVEAYYAWIDNNASDPETFWHGGWKLECTITNIVGNTLYLDRPIFWGYLDDNDNIPIVKTNKNFVITGTMGPTNSFNDWRWPNITTNGGSAAGRIHLFRNARMDYLGSARHSGISDYTRGFRIHSYDYWNAVNIDSCVFMMGCDAYTYNGVYSNAGHMILRNSVVVGHRMVGHRYNSSYTGSAFFNNKIMSCLNLYLHDVECFGCSYNEITAADTGIALNTIRRDSNIVPFSNEIRRNFIRGVSNTGLTSGSESVGASRHPRVIIESNKMRGVDDYVFAGNMFSGSPILDNNAFAEHTGSRLSRYRNEGHISQGDVSSDMSYVFPHLNSGRFGYDITYSMYHMLVRHHNKIDVIEEYGTNGDDLYAFFGIEIDVLEDVPFRVFVSMDYRYSPLSRLQDDGNLDGQLLCYAVQDGTNKITKYGVTPSTAGTGWNTFTYTFTEFASTAGKSAVYMTRDAQNGFVEFKNGTAYILTDYPDKIRVIANSFNLKYIWDQYAEQRDMRPLTANHATKVRKLKL